MAINKVVFGNNTLIDLTSDTIAAEKLLKGYTAHDASGASIVGTYEGGGGDGYTINLFASSSELYGQSIVVSYEGQRITTIQFSNAGTASIVVQEEGAYNFAVSYGGLTYYCDVNVISAVVTYNETIYYYPNGSTVTPINDVQIWISCADVRDKNYTTLAEVFADSELLATLMSSENAVNYLVRSKQFIGNKALVPNMTSNTTPSGVCFGSGTESGDYYLSFDGNDSSTPYLNPRSPSKSYVGYMFDEAVAISKVHLKTRNDKAGHHKIQGSEDGVVWEDLTADTVTNSSNYIIDFDIDSTKKYKYIRDYGGCDSSTAYANFVYTLQFYSKDGVTQNQTAMSYIGASDYASDTLLSDTDWNEAIQNSEYFELVDNVKVPKMTSNTTPEGECFASTFYESGRQPWNAFDDNENTFWQSSQTSVSGQYVGYAFDESVKICCIKMLAGTPTYPATNVSFKVQSSNSGQTFTDITEFSNLDFSDITIKTLVFALTNDIRFRVLFSSMTTATTYKGLVTSLQFYGRINGGVQTWLRKAGITDKLYTTLAEVLSDTTTLEELIKNKNAVDYLVTCKGWSEQICADQNAMYYIGQNNYCANTLLADATWCNAICNSTYFESVLNVKVPTMTSNTTPEGEVIYDSSNATYPPYYAFDGNDNTLCATANDSPTLHYFGYVFVEPVKIYFVEWIPRFDHKTRTKVQVSEDGSAWIDMTDFIADNLTTKQKYSTVLENPSTNRHWRCQGNVTDGNGYGMNYFTIQFYGRKDVPEPTDETLLYENGTQYVTLNNRISGSSNASSFQESYIQCNYYSSSGSGFVSTEGFDVTGKKYFKLNFKLANSTELQHQHCMVADLEYFLKQGITSLKFGFRYSGNGCALYLVDSQYDINPSNTNTKYVSGCVSGGNNYIVIDKIWLE